MIKTGTPRKPIYCEICKKSYIDFCTKHGIPYVSDELMEKINKLFYHGEQRAKSHDQRFGQWLSNKICKKYNCSRGEAGHILCLMENPEFLEMVKDYND